MLLPAARVLICHWAKLLSNEDAGRGSNGRMVRRMMVLGDRHCNYIKNGHADFVVVQHIPMHPNQVRGRPPVGKPSRRSAPPPCLTTAGSGSSTMTKMGTKVDLHISFARPIYLPTPSVASFLGNINRAIWLAVSIAHGHGKFGSGCSTANCHNAGGQTLHLRPRGSIILIND
jgi:hypothetical protein